MDYVSHVHYELIGYYLSSRYSSSTSWFTASVLHLSLVLNHLLNVCCGIGDLGCVTFILIGFEDRELITNVLEVSFGSRLHLSSFGSASNSCNVSLFFDLFGCVQSKLDVVLDVIMVRHNVSRVYNVVSVSSSLSLSSSFSGPMIVTSGVPLDVRLDCVVNRSVLSIVVGGGIIIVYL